MIQPFSRIHLRSLPIFAIKTVAIIAALAGLVGAASAQDTDSPNEVPIQLRTLTMTGNAPAALQQQIAAALQGGTYSLDELQDRIRQKLADAGYYDARVMDAEQTDVRQQAGLEVVDVSVRVRCGDEYQMGEITFNGAKAYPVTQLRSQFPITKGALFNASAVSKGLEQLKTLYQSAGYANFGAVPKPEVDEDHHVVNLQIDIAEGGQLNFGQLMLDGLEPRSGAAKTLTAAWKDMEGKRYNPQQLQQWLSANTADWPKDAVAQVRTENVSDPDPHLIDVLVHFQ
ncbi:MAG TPA: POTRA domain-containing protein [Terracidiphilus sp.]|nr:POTRA domain-containing protein [Terracidiphilus sp.]